MLLKLAKTRIAKRAAISIGISLLISSISAVVLFHWEALAAGPMATLCVSPAPLLYLFIEKHRPQRSILKHVAFHLYWGAWLAYFTLGYFFAGDEVPEVFMICLSFLSIAGLSCYLSLLLTKKNSNDDIDSKGTETVSATNI